MVRGVSAVFRPNDYTSQRPHSMSILMNAGYSLTALMSHFVSHATKAFFDRGVLPWVKEGKTENRRVIFLDLNLNKS